LTREGNALIVRSFMGPTVKTIYLPALSTIGFAVTGTDQATISFGEPTLPPWWNSRRGPIPAPAFEYIAGASKVYDLIQQLQQGRRTV